MCAFVDAMCDFASEDITWSCYGLYQEKKAVELPKKPSLV